MGQGGNGRSQGRRYGMKKRFYQMHEGDEEALTLLKLLISPFSYKYQIG